jgi:hypothetical protein
MTATPSPTPSQSPTATPSPTVTATPVPPVTGGLLLNPSFEQGATHWYIDGEGQVVSADPHGGARAMRLELGGGYAGQNLALYAGNTYELTVWGKLDGKIDLGYVGVSYLSADGTRLEELEPPMIEFIQPYYEQKSMTFTIPNAVAEFSIFAWKPNGPAAFLVDDFYLLQKLAPEPVPSVTPTNNCQQLIAPAYFYPPTGLWDQLIDGGSEVAFIVLNPDSGVDTKHEWRYDAPLAKARAAGIRIVGYIETNYSNRPAAEVIQEMDRYREWYGVTSFFLDEADTDPASIPLYKQMTDHAHAMGGMTILNFGYKPHPGYMEITDIAIVFEDNAVVYSTYELPAWISEYPASRFAQMIYGVTEGNIDQVLAKALASNAGYVWITDDHISTGSPYDTLPSYWQELNTIVGAGC